jgi:hypothetical protein
VSTTIAASPGATRPTTSEFLPYYERYIALVPEGDVNLDARGTDDRDAGAASTLPASVATYRYAPRSGASSELVGHS